MGDGRAFVVQDNHAGRKGRVDERVPTTTLAELIGDDDVAVLKIDCEGLEKEVFESGAMSLDKVSLVLAEIKISNRGETLKLLQGHGFPFVYLVAEDYYVPWKAGKQFTFVSNRFMRMYEVMGAAEGDLTTAEINALNGEDFIFSRHKLPADLEIDVVAEVKGDVVVVSCLVTACPVPARTGLTMFLSVDGSWCASDNILRCLQGVLCDVPRSTTPRQVSCEVRLGNGTYVDSTDIEIRH
mmetsp:Transcript_64950/g.153518  ORF Transcript_64950/g.153518 Transcript_64950/m.153518 type:complete len:240 (+) Transcript_64950:620-1339(+)